MEIRPATPFDLEQALGCLVGAFAGDPNTGFLLGGGPGYEERLSRFFSLLMRARMALDMPVFVAHDGSGIHGAAMGYATARPAWPADLTQEWNRFETQTPGLADRMAVYDAIAEKSLPSTAHYYLGVIGTAPGKQGSGIGTQLLRSFCRRSAADHASSGVVLETANPSNVRFYERAGFAVVGRGRLGSATLWCLFLSHPLRRLGLPQRVPPQLEH